MIAEGVLIFGLSPQQVGDLTYLEFSVMMERYNEKMKNDYEMQRNVIFNAIINANRKKNSKIVPLFNEKNEKTTTEIIEEREELFGNR